jgi:hypothetical protein
VTLLISRRFKEYRLIDTAFWILSWIETKFNRCFAPRAVPELVADELEGVSDVVQVR